MLNQDEFIHYFIDYYMQKSDNRDYQIINFKGKNLYNHPECAEPIERPFLAYSKDWRWLMPAIEIICDAFNNIDYTKLTKQNFNKYQSFYDKLDNFSFIRNQNDSFYDLYFILISFVEWYYEIEL